MAMTVNSSLFEMTGHCGYALKPRVLRDPTHPLYGRFDPGARDFPGHSGVLLDLTVVSGQHVCPGQPTASPCVELEIIGVPSDCTKERSRLTMRNAVNPVWQHHFVVRINFLEFAFIRLAVLKNAGTKCVAQRIVPLLALRPGFRHVRLRSPANQPLDQATLFLHSRFEEEEHIYLHDDDGPVQSASERSIAFQLANTHLQQTGVGAVQIPMLKKQIFVLKINGLATDYVATFVHAESNSSVRSVIQSALLTCGKSADAAEDYVLIEESQPITDRNDGSTDSTMMTNQRILPPNEAIMDAVACWNGSTRRFVIRKKGSDPSSRAWISSIIKSGTQTLLVDQNGRTPPPNNDNKASLVSKSQSSSRQSLNVDSGRSNEVVRSTNSFLVCVHNVCDEQPYIIFRTSINSTARDIIKQVFAKARRIDASENDFALIEELPLDGTGQATQSVSNSGTTFHGGVLRVLRDTAMSKKRSNDMTGAVGQAAATVIPVNGNRTANKDPRRRVLSSDENVWQAQTKWRNAGRFVLENRVNVVRSTLDRVRDFLRTLDGARHKYEQESA